MISNPLVSTIIPFWNAEKFLQETIESVFAQTYDRWELLLIDDGSTDGSTAIARHYAQKYPEKVRYLEHDSHQNRGVCASRNLGLQQAKGIYIALLDSDDVWLPHKLEEQVAIMESQPEAAMIYGASVYWYGWTGKPEDIQRDWIASPTLPCDTLIKPPILLTSCILVAEHKTATPPPSDILLRREVVERIGGFEEESFLGKYHCQQFEDFAFLTKLYLQEPVFVASNCWDKYRIHPDSCSAVVTKTGSFEAARLIYLNWAEKYLSEKAIENPQVWQAFRNKQWLHYHPFWNNLFRNYEYAAYYLSLQIRILPRIIARKILPTNIYQWLKFQFKRLKYISQA